MKRPTILKLRAATAAILLGMAPTLPSQGALLRVPEDYSSIQQAVDTAITGDEIQIASGIYTEQVIIENKNLTLTGRPGAVIRAWSGMTLSSRYEWLNLIEVTHATLIVRGLEFEGEWLASMTPFHNGFAALYYGASGGTVENCIVHGFRGPKDVGTINGVGFVNWNPVSLGSGTVNVQLLNNRFADNGLSIWLAGDWLNNPDLLRTTFNVEGNIINGIGPTTLGSEHGILIGCGAEGSVKGNRITDHYRLNPNVLEKTAGILAYDLQGFINSGRVSSALRPIRFEDNTFVNNQQAIAAALATDSRFLNNIVQGPDGLNSDGLLLTGANVVAATNRFTNLTGGVVLVGEDPDFGTIFGIATNATLTANRFCQVRTPIVVQPKVGDFAEHETLTCPYPVPHLAIAPAVIVSWPNDGGAWTLESALRLDGPWAPVPATPTLENGNYSSAIGSEGQHRFFRLR